MGNESMIKSAVCDYILEHVNIESLDYDDDIFEEGLVNSLFAIELMVFLEKTFSIKITMEDLDMEHFKSINSIYDFVNKKANLL